MKKGIKYNFDEREPRRPFTVPEGYFENLTGRIMASLPGLVHHDYRDSVDAHKTVPLCSCCVYGYFLLHQSRCRYHLK